jgi:hypothetical protein
MSGYCCVLIYLFFFLLFCKHVIMGEKIVKKDVCLYLFLFMLLNYKNKKDRIEWLIWIWLNILKTNKIMLYFLWKYKNMFLYIFWDLITDLLKP